MTNRRVNLQKINTTNLALRLTLIELLLRPIGLWFMQPVFLTLACLGLAIPGLLHNVWLWAGLTLLTTLRVYIDWPLSDNHAYLLCYWCLAITIALHLQRNHVNTARQYLAFNGILLIGLTFFFAALWKLTLSPDYSDGTFFRVMMLFDYRLEAFARLAGGLSAEQFFALQQLVTAGDTGQALPVETNRFKQLALLAAGWNITLNMLLAISFLWLCKWPARWQPARIRNELLLLFCFVTYAVANVDSFAWLLIAMGVAQLSPETRSQKSWLLPAYLVCFIAILLYRALPFLGNIILQPHI